MKQLESIFEQLEKLKACRLDPTMDAIELDDETFKAVYSGATSQLLKQKKVSERIQHIFKDFNFDAAILQPKAILVIITADKVTTENFEKFISAKKNLTSRDIYLILTYLSQTEFKSTKLIKKLEASETLGKIMSLYKEGHIFISSPGYFDLKEAQVLKIAEYPNVIEQIRLRIQCEQRQEYSVGLNHLVNEIQAICAHLDPEASKDKYEVTQMIQFLIRKEVPFEICSKIRNLFDRRNKNPVSHSDPIAWAISEQEYFDYRKYVGICLSYILTKNTQC